MSQPASLNGDLSSRAAVQTAQMDWAASPSGTVWRKRVHLVGPPESGQVTSIVRYQSNARFPAHDHPDGEEILVLDGVFSDEHGDWPAGTYLLNPEGFRHAPFSVDGCTLLVKLRQFPGRDREHHVIQTRDLAWVATPLAGVSQKALYRQAGFSDAVRLERWAAGARHTVAYADGVEYFVLDGEFRDVVGACVAGTWLRLPAGSEHTIAAQTDCTLYVKTGGFPYLRDGAAV